MHAQYLITYGLHALTLSNHNSRDYYYNLLKLHLLRGTSVLFLYSMQLMNLKVSLLEASKPLKLENEGTMNTNQREVEGLKVYWIVAISKDYNLMC